MKSKHLSTRLVWAMMSLAVIIGGMSSLFLLTGATTRAASAGPALKVDVNANRYLIDPGIYGESYADATLMQQGIVTADRWGGDGTTQYNWLADSSNAGSDFYYLGGSGQTTPTPGASADAQLTTDEKANAQSVLTIPLAGLVNKSAAYSCSYPRSVYPNQQAYNPYVHPNGDDCGNGIDPSTGNKITDTDPLSNHLAVDSTWMKAWIQHLVQVHGTAAAGGVPIYQMDNEPESWSNVHHDIHPASTGFDEYLNKTIDYASMIKSVDPTAQILGPSNFGVPAFFDMSLAGDDEASHNMAWVPYYLQKLYQYQQQHGVRLLNYLDEHFYAVQSGNNEDPASDAQRLRSTRSLWDPTYTEESYIGQYFTQAEQVQLIPRLRTWAQQYYPGTKLGLTEYNFGDQNGINGALAEADALGIFGREQLNIATIFGGPKSTDAAANSFRIYRDFDGKGAQYGDIWVQSVSADQGQLSVYGSQRSRDNALTLVMVNKTGNDLTSTLSLANFNANSTALVYQYSAANLAGIVQQPDLTVSSSGFSYTYPANSITEIVIPQQGTPYVGGAAANPSASQFNTLQPDVPTYKLYKNQTYPTVVTSIDANGVGTPVTSGVTFSSDNTAVASVDANGVVTGQSAGVAHITGSSNGRSFTVTVTVIDVQSITLIPSSVTLPAGGQTLDAAIANYTDGSTQPLAASSVTYSTDNAAVASVDANGILTAKGPGTATITATYNALTTTQLVTVPATQPLPAGWQQQDIGAVATAGNVAYADGVFNVTGAGTDVYGNQDQGHFVYQALPADGTLITRITNVQNVQGYAAGGLMIRDGLSSGAHLAFLATFPSGTFQFKAGNATAGNIGTIWSNNGSNSLPYWLKLDRTGNAVTASISPDGTTWTTGGTTPFPTGNAYIGLFATSHGAAIMNTSTFDHVTFNNGTSTIPPFTGDLPGGWTKTDIGAVSQPANVGYQNGVFSLQAAGADVSGTTDQEGFIYQSLPADGSITARVVTQGHSNDYAKAGVMIRNGLQPGSDLALLALVPVGAVQLSAGNTTATNGITNVWNTNAPPYGTAINPPYWLRLVRSGGTITAFTSPDGTTWTQQYQGSFPTGAAYVGLEDDSHDDLQFNTATFDNVSTTGTVGATANGWTSCASEGGTCTFTGTQVVRYGANGKFAYQTATGSIGCNNSVFGDPNVGTVKACSTAPVPPSSWTKCADEGGTCTVSGTVTVAYGANGKFVYHTVTGSTGCNNGSFGDPIVGTVKACYFL